MYKSHNIMSLPRNTKLMSHNKSVDLTLYPMAFWDFASYGGGGGFLTQIQETRL